MQHLSQQAYTVSQWMLGRCCSQVWQTALSLQMPRKETSWLAAATAVIHHNMHPFTEEKTNIQTNKPANKETKAQINIYIILCEREDTEVRETWGETLQGCSLLCLVSKNFRHLLDFCLVSSQWYFSSTFEINKDISKIHKLLQVYENW